MHICVYPVLWYSSHEGARHCVTLLLINPCTLTFLASSNLTVSTIATVERRSLIYKCIDEEYYLNSINIRMFCYDICFGFLMEYALACKSLHSLLYCLSQVDNGKSRRISPFLCGGSPNQYHLIMFYNTWRHIRHIRRKYLV